MHQDTARFLVVMLAMFAVFALIIAAGAFVGYHFDPKHPTAAATTAKSFFGVALACVASAAILGSLLRLRPALFRVSP
jgi:Na+-driven multidrug efflux pump